MFWDNYKINHDIKLTVMLLKIAKNPLKCKTDIMYQLDCGSQKFVCNCVPLDKTPP